MKIVTILFVIFIVASASYANAGDKFNNMSPAEHLKYAKETIKSNNFVTANMLLMQYSRVLLITKKRQN